MANIFTDILKQAGNALLTGDNLSDYKHASRLFVADNYRLMPKMGYLFHVFFDINPNASFPDPTNPNRDREIGLLVKSVGLPKFNVDLKKNNAYNRPNFTQTKISYDPITITFHDDSANVIRNLWYDYYNYHYRDSDYSEELYHAPHKYEATRRTDRWGYTPRGTKAEPYLKSIRIYSLHQKQFSEYVLMNPIVRSFKHGEHTQGQVEPIQHEMTVEFESVLYYYGSVTPSTVRGFADLHYDKTPSPIKMGSRSILGPYGLLETADDAIKNLQEGNYAAAALLGMRALNNAKNMDLKKAAIGELLGVGTSVLRGNNAGSSLFVPTLGSSGTNLLGLGVAGLSLAKGGGIGTGLLAGAAGLGALGLLGRAGSSGANQEMSDAVSAAEGVAPYSAYEDFPAPDSTDPTLVDSYDTSYSNSEPPDLSNWNEYDDSATNQGSVNSTGSKLQLETNIATSQAKLQALEVETNQLKEQQQLTEDAVNSMITKKEELLGLGVDPSDPQIANLNKQIDQQISVAQAQDSRLNELRGQVDGLASSVERYLVQYEGL